MRGSALLVYAGAMLVVLAAAPPTAAIEGQPRTRLILAGEYDEIIRLGEARLRQQPTRRAVADLADEWVRFRSLKEAAEHYESLDEKDTFHALILAEVYGRLGRLERVPQPPPNLPEAVRAAFNGVYFDYALFDRIDWKVPLEGQRINDRLIIYLNRTGQFDLAARMLEHHLALGSEDVRRRQAGMQYKVMWGTADNPERLYLLLHQRAFKLDELHARYRKALASDEDHPAVYHEYVRILSMLKMKPEPQAFGGRINESTYQGVLAAIAVREAEGNHEEVVRLCTKALEMPIPDEFRRAWTWNWSAVHRVDEIDRLIRVDIEQRLAEAYRARGELDKAKAIYTSFLDKEWRRKWPEGVRGLEAIAEAEDDETFDLHALVQELAADEDPLSTQMNLAELYGRLRDIPHEVEHERRAIDLMLDAGPQGELAGSVPQRVRRYAALLRREKREEERAELLDAALNRMKTWELHGDQFRHGLFELYEEAEDYKAGLALLLEMIDGGKLKAATLHHRLSEGYSVAQKGKLVWEFFRRLEKVIPKYPSTPEFHRVWADVYLDDYQPKRVIEFLDKIGPDLEPADYHDMARAYEIAGDFANAARCRERAILSEWALPSTPLAGYYVKAGQNEEAVNVLVKVIESVADARHLDDVSRFAASNGVDGLLVKRLAGIVEREEATWKHHVVLAELYRERNATGDAVAHYRSACNLNPGQHEVVYRYARFLDEQKMGHLAVPIYERCFSLPNCRDDVGPRLLDLYRAEERLDDALTLSERLLAERPKRDERFYAGYVELAEKQDALARGKAFLERLVHNYPNEAAQPKRWLAEIVGKLEP